MELRFNSNIVVVEVEKLVEDKMEFAGTKLYFAGDYNKEKNARIYGIVKQVPRKLNGDVVGFEKSSKVAVKQRRANEMEIDIQIGDKVYFHYLLANEKNLLQLGQKELLLTVPYHQLLCRVRNGVVKGLATHILVSPENETWEDITTDHGIITKSTPGEKTRTGVVKYTGQNYKDEGEELVPGDRILFMKHANRAIEVEGERLFPIKYYHILGTIPDDEIQVEGH